MRNADQVRKRVGAIWARAGDGDDEMASFLERDLYLSVLRQIANGHPTPATLAEEAVKAAEIAFSRVWHVS